MFLLEHLKNLMQVKQAGIRIVGKKSEWTALPYHRILFNNAWKVVDDLGIGLKS